MFRYGLINRPTLLVLPPPCRYAEAMHSDVKSAIVRLSSISRVVALKPRYLQLTNPNSPSTGFYVRTATKDALLSDIAVLEC